MKKRILALVMVAAMAAGLAGCGESPSPDASGAAESSSSGEKGELNLLAWSGIDDEAIQKLEEMTGYTINYTQFSSLEEMETKVMSNSTQYDVAMCSDYVIEALVAQEQLEEIDTSRLSNYEYLGTQYLSPSYDPENKWSVPYSGGGIGILINRDAVDTEITSYADLWNPELQGQIAFTDDERMALCITNLVNGNDFNASDEEAIRAAGAKLEELLPNIHAFTYSDYKMILNGEANILVIATGSEYKAAKEMDNWEFVIPAEGMHMFIDSYVIPKGADMDAAYAFIDAIISEEYLTRKGEDTNWGYGYCNTKVEEAAIAAGISEELMQIAYPEVDSSTTHYMANIGEASLIYDEVWTELKLSAGSKME
ncbi:MAG: spermidine/putrescine ABC transporter substrate-binding protein [Lachnospiraceae bacterium]|nr:spermidine/putrescine ABC transporter substrate-binding protein [Lachnospiraceae bacterium]